MMEAVSVFETSVNGAISQKVVLFILAAVRT
jgi:hypothetical protein